MKAISLHQPWATLCVTRRPCDVCADLKSVGYVAASCDEGGMVKRFETRSWPCPKSVIGQRIAIHATKRRPTPGPLGEYAYVDVDGGLRFGKSVYPSLPLGAVVGSGIITASYPIVDRPSDIEGGEQLPGLIEVYHGRPRLDLWPPGENQAIDISDQLPYGDWTPGRYAWQIDDAAPTTERCPWCWGERFTYSENCYDDCGLECRSDCILCDAEGRCDPIPATGRQRIWEWTPN